MMTPRERFYAVTSHPPKWPDRVCNEFIGASGTVSILDEEPYGLKAIAEYIGVPDYADPLSDPIWGYTNVDQRILEKFSCDFRNISAVTAQLPERLPNGYLRGSYGSLWKPMYGVSRSGVPRMMIVPEKELPGAQLRTLKDIEEYPYWPDTESSTAREVLEKAADEVGKVARKLHEETDYVVWHRGGSYSFESHRYVRGFMSTFSDLRKNTEFYHAFAGRMLRHGMDVAEINLNAIGDFVDCIQAGPGDMGTQSGPMISLKDFREFVAPYEKQSNALIRKYTKARIRAHMCGSIHLYMKDLAELGVDIVGQQISPNTFRMEPERLRRDYGDIITFWGGIDTQVVLVSYTPEQIREWVRRCIYALAPGHIVASNHAVQSDVPPENLWMAHKAVEEFSRLVYGE